MNDKPKSAMNVVPVVLIIIAVFAAIIYTVAFKEEQASGIEEKQALDAEQVEKLVEEQPNSTPPVIHE